jgi:hypothetical protein
MAIYVHRNDQQLGPYSVAEVKSQLASGALSTNDYVWWKGQQGWVPLGGSPVLEPDFKDPEGTPQKKDDSLTGLSSFSVAAVVAGCLFPLSFFTSVPAIIFGHCALDEIKKNPGRTGRGMAIFGLVLGYFFTLLSIGILCCYLYFRDDVEAAKAREDIVNSDVFVPPVPSKTTAPATAPTPAPAANPPAAVTPPPAPSPSPTTNLDQPIAPATANPGQ